MAIASVIAGTPSLQHALISRRAKCRGPETEAKTGLVRDSAAEALFNDLNRSQRDLGPARRHRGRQMERGCRRARGGTAGFLYGVSATAATDRSITALRHLLVHRYFSGFENLKKGDRLWRQTTRYAVVSAGTTWIPHESEPTLLSPDTSRRGMHGRRRLFLVQSSPSIIRRPFPIVQRRLSCIAREPHPGRRD